MIMFMLLAVYGPYCIIDPVSCCYVLGFLVKMALAGRKMNAETSLVVMCCKFVGGTLFYSQVGGY